MPVTQADLQKLKTKFLALREYLQTTQLNGLNYGTAENNLADLKNQVIGIAIGDEIGNITEAEWVYLNVPKFNDGSNVDPNPATSIIIDATNKALERIAVVAQLTDQQLSKIEFADLVAEATTIQELEKYNKVARALTPAHFALLENFNAVIGISDANLSKYNAVKDALTDAHFASLGDFNAVVSAHDKYQAVKDALTDAHFASLGDFSAVVGISDADLNKYKAVRTDLTPAHLAQFANFNAVVGISDDNLGKYKAVRTVLGKDSAHFASLGDFNAVVGISNANLQKIVLHRLNPASLVEIFNIASAGEDYKAAKNYFINHLKMKRGIGLILSPAVIDDSVSETKTRFNDAAAKLFDSLAKVAQKNKDGKFVENSVSLEALEVTKFEVFKAFIGALFKSLLVIPAVLEYLGIGEKYLKSARALKNDAKSQVEGFEKLLTDQQIMIQVPSLAPAA
jgi:hypothetical protein